LVRRCEDDDGGDPVASEFCDHPVRSLTRLVRVTFLAGNDLRKETVT
jgi:hypothetical protein